MNVLHITYRDEIVADGITSSVKGIIECLARTNISTALVTFVQSRYRPNLPYSDLSSIFTDNTSSQPDIRISCSPFSFLGFLHLLFDFRLTLSFVRLFLNADIVHFHGLWSPYLSFLALLRTIFGKTYVWSPHGMLSPQCLQQAAFKKRLAWFFYQYFSLKLSSSILYSSRYEIIVSLTSFKPVNYSVIPNLSDSHRWCVDDLQNRQITPSLHHKQVVFLGRLHPVKNLEELLYSWHSSKVSEYGWNLKLVGPDQDDYSKRLKHVILECGIQYSVEILPPVKAKSKYHLLDSSSYLILPSLSENFGNVVPEAFSRGLPVIVSSFTPWSNVDQLGCGRVFVPGTHSLSSVLASCIEVESSEYFHMSKSSELSYLRQFSHDALIPEYIGFYCELLGSD